MNSEERMILVQRKYIEQNGKCAHCGKSLKDWQGPVELAHKVPRGQLKRRGLPEWHPEAVDLVCTRKGKNCNDGRLLPIGLPREHLMQRLEDE